MEKENNPLSDRFLKLDLKEEFFNLDIKTIHSILTNVDSFINDRIEKYYVLNEDEIKDKNDLMELSIFTFYEIEKEISWLKNNLKINCDYGLVDKEELKGYFDIK